MANYPKRTSHSQKRLLNEYLLVEYKKKKRNDTAWDNKLYEIVAINKKVKIRHKGYSEEADEWRENVRNFAPRTNSIGQTASSFWTISFKSNNIINHIEKVVLNC